MTGGRRIGRVLILLPPSEGKAPAGDGPPLDLDSLVLPALGKTRNPILNALTKVASGSEKRALATLGLTPGLAGELEADRGLRTSATLPAAERYTGVLYDALDLPSLLAPDAGVDSRVLIFSGLWGVVRPSDRIPRYRCSMNVTLPRLGGLASRWRTALGSCLPRYVGSQLVVDLRSGTYMAPWKPGEHAVVVRVLLERDGKRSIVSHFNKATKGRLARSLLTSPAEPRDAKEFAELVGSLGFVAELVAPARPGTPWGVDVIVDEV